MAVEIVTDADALLSRLEGETRTAVLGFFGSFSETARRVEPDFRKFCEAHPDVPAYLVDVGRVKGLHARFGVSAVPTAVAVEGMRAIRRAVGPHDADGYARALLGTPAPARDGSPRRPGHRVTVFTTPTCTFCTRVKAHLRQHGVPFKEIDVSRDQAAMQRMVARSGQMGVPQLDIDGRMIVGFDRPRIDALLGLSGARAEAPAP